MAVKAFGFIRELGLENRLRGTGQHFQRVLPVEQQRPDTILGRTAVGHPVVERQPSGIGQDRGRTAADLLLPSPFTAGDEQMAGFILPRSRSSENFSQIEGYFTP